MSSDFTTNSNKKISKESVYIMLSDIMGYLFSNFTGGNNSITYSYHSPNLKNNLTNGCLNMDCFNPEYFYNMYKDEGCFEEDPEKDTTKGIFDLYLRYKKSNNYTNNKFDDIILLSAAVDEDDLLDKDDETIDNRKRLILEKCESLISDGFCSNLSITGFFPHLDKPFTIESLNSISGDIPCIEYGYTSIYAKINYVDSCGMESLQPIPSFKDFIIDYYDEISHVSEYYSYQFGEITDKYLYNTLEDERLKSSTFKWEIIKNEDDIIVKDKIYTSNIIEIATLSSAINPDIEISLIYSE